MKKTIVPFILMSGMFSACKENTILPSDLVPPIDNINTFAQDTFSLITNNVYQDSLLTGGLKNSTQISASSTYYQALGTIKDDPTFGKTYANIHVEVLPPVPNFAFKTGTQRTIDSIILSIPYKGSFGDTLTAPIQTFKVFRSLKTFPRGESQYEFTKDSVDNTLLSSLNVNFNTLRTDSPSVNGVKLVPQLRFKMSQAFIDSLEDQIDLGANGAAADFSKFLAWWKGFYIQADSNNGSTLGYFDTYKTKLSIHYRYTNTNSQLDTVADVFSFDPNYCNRFNNINRNYTGTVVQNFYNSMAPLGDSILFIQREPGMAAFVKMPFLHLFKNVLVNKAELYFYSISPYNSFLDTVKYGTIPRMQIFQTDSAGVDNIILDYNIFGTNIVDGNAQKISVGPYTITQYKFAVTYSIQKLISEKNSNFRFKIMGLNNGYPASNRVMLAGNSTNIPNVKPRLKIIYTNIQK